jgi:hypothetical protein
MSIPEELKRLRDQKAEVYHATFGQGAFQEGFNQCHSLVSEREKELEAKLQMAVEGLRECCKVTYGTELCNTDEENNEILARHFFALQKSASQTLEKLGVKSV